MSYNSKNNIHLLEKKQLLRNLKFKEVTHDGIGKKE